MNGQLFFNTRRVENSVIQGRWLKQEGDNCEITNHLSVMCGYDVALRRRNANLDINSRKDR